MIESISPNDTILLVVDVQERMMQAIPEAEMIIDNISRLIRGCQQFNIPIVVTEQYPKGLGPTVEPIRQALGEGYQPVEKMSFSAVKEIEFLQAFEATGRHSILVCGVETHVCVYQSARDLHNLGWTVEIVTDAVGSRNPRNRIIALERLEHHGVDFTSVEMSLFSMLETADAPQFKSISSIVK